MRGIPRIVLLGVAIGAFMGVLSKLDASEDVACERGNPCVLEGDRCLDSGNRFLECADGSLRPARPDVSGASCRREDMMSRDACGQALMCRSGAWVDMLGNRGCTR